MEYNSWEEIALVLTERPDILELMKLVDEIPQEKQHDAIMKILEFIESLETDPEAELQI